jgi:Flp pilus assembly protein TadB
MLSWYRGIDGDWCVLCQSRRGRVPAAFSFVSSPHERAGPESSTMTATSVTLFLALVFLVFVALMIIAWWITPVVVLVYFAAIVAAILALTGGAGARKRD